ncbi:3'-5' exonuclease [Ehrlichia ruminantium]|uniref:3'-5' exonuclease n=1 Tax=Ehrlichia ruminantium TaxID=779 RepID=A0A170T1U2_EHRRU|nr:3'-5' exonuclease [Ehrlichia ruminantium]GAT75421.1 3'-5' exonuclease [Ehrlichia ruminantium]GAT77408.1 3'-5' exonuclease [Ehrlichia ruminantium]GAT78534.1 3'-5' exonuclease [Ehrlichia ruminantium]
MLSNLLVFDIETVPDVNVCNNLLDNFDDVYGVTERRDALANYHLEITDGKNSFLRQPFHKVVAISFLKASIRKEGEYESFHLQEVRSGGKIDSTEEDLLKGFFQYASSLKPRFVSFNGRTFDFPVLKYRAMVYGIQAGCLYKVGDKWNNYFQRYSIDWHCDLLDYLSDFGTSARIKMNEVCSILNFPGKFGTDGSKVIELYDNDKISEIRDYCETDVINTYLVYLRVMHHQSRITTLSYNQSIDDLLLYLDVSQKKHLQQFKLEWNKACSGNFYL